MSPANLTIDVGPCTPEKWNRGMKAAEVGSKSAVYSATNITQTPISVWFTVDKFQFIRSSYFLLQYKSLSAL